jgi:chromosome condensin MukBEF MukE localization factor
MSDPDRERLLEEVRRRVERLRELVRRLRP